MSLQWNVHCLSFVKCFNWRMDLHCWLTQKLIFCQYFQTKNWTKLPMSSKSNFSAQEQNLVTQLSQVFGLQKLFLYDESIIDSCLYLQLIEWCVFCIKGVVELNDSSPFFTRFYLLKVDMRDVWNKVSYFLKAMIPCLI